VALTGKKEFISAVKVLDEVLALTKHLNDRTRETELLWRSAELSYEMRNYARASELAQSALELARLTHSPKLIYLATTTLGKSYAALSMTEPAIKTLYEAVNKAESLRETVAGNEIQSELFFENKVNAYHSLVDLLVKQRRPMDALLVAERAKGRVLLDVMKGGQSDVTKLLTVDEKHEGQELNRKISEINDLIRAQQNNDSNRFASCTSAIHTSPPMC
jgi:tetratricopeptide (TPR) repeat protein